MTTLPQTNCHNTETIVFIIVYLQEHKEDWEMKRQSKSNVQIINVALKDSAAARAAQSIRLQQGHERRRPCFMLSIILSKVENMWEIRH